ncbi:hypothetical protein QJQ45_027121, partial [Haematococcus lacustris]
AQGESKAQQKHMKHDELRHQLELDEAFVLVSRAVAPVCMPSAPHWSSIVMCQSCNKIERCVTHVDKLSRVRAKSWVALMREPQTNNVVWKRNRNHHAQLLLSQLESGTLAPPYRNVPPEGGLPTLQGWTRTRYTSPSRARHGRASSPDMLARRRDGLSMSLSAGGCQEQQRGGRPSQPGSWDQPASQLQLSHAAPLPDQDQPTQSQPRTTSPLKPWPHTGAATGNLAQGGSAAAATASALTPAGHHAPPRPSAPSNSHTAATVLLPDVKQHFSDPPPPPPRPHTAVAVMHPARVDGSATASATQDAADPKLSATPPASGLHTWRTDQLPAPDPAAASGQGSNITHTTHIHADLTMGWAGAATPDGSPQASLQLSVHAASSFEGVQRQPGQRHSGQGHGCQQQPEAPHRGDAGRQAGHGAAHNRSLLSNTAVPDTHMAAAAGSRPAVYLPPSLQAALSLSASSSNARDGYALVLKALGLPPPHTNQRKQVWPSSACLNLQPPSASTALTAPGASAPGASAPSASSALSASAAPQQGAEAAQPQSRRVHKAGQGPTGPADKPPQGRGQGQQHTGPRTTLSLHARRVSAQPAPSQATADQATCDGGFSSAGSPARLARHRSSPAMLAPAASHQSQSLRSSVDSNQPLRQPPPRLSGLTGSQAWPGGPTSLTGPRHCPSSPLLARGGSRSQLSRSVHSPLRHSRPPSPLSRSVQLQGSSRPGSPRGRLVQLQGQPAALSPVDYTRPSFTALAKQNLAQKQLAKTLAREQLGQELQAVGALAEAEAAALEEGSRGGGGGPREVEEAEGGSVTEGAAQGMWGPVEEEKEGVQERVQPRGGAGGSAADPQQQLLQELEVALQEQEQWDAAEKQLRASLQHPHPQAVGQTPAPVLAQGLRHLSTERTSSSSPTHSGSSNTSRVTPTGPDPPHSPGRHCRAESDNLLHALSQLDLPAGPTSGSHPEQLLELPRPGRPSSSSSSSSSSFAFPRNQAGQGAMPPQDPPHAVLSEGSQQLQPSTQQQRADSWRVQVDQEQRRAHRRQQQADEWRATPAQPGPELAIPFATRPPTPQDPNTQHSHPTPHTCLSALQPQDLQPRLGRLTGRHPTSRAALLQHSGQRSALTTSSTHSSPPADPEHGRQWVLRQTAGCYTGQQGADCSAAGHLLDRQEELEHFAEACFPNQQSVTQPRGSHHPHLSQALPGSGSCVPTTTSSLLDILEDIRSRVDAELDFPLSSSLSNRPTVHTLARHCSDPGSASREGQPGRPLHSLQLHTTADDPDNNTRARARGPPSSEAGQGRLAPAWPNSSPPSNKRVITPSGIEPPTSRVQEHSLAARPCLHPTLVAVRADLAQFQQQLEQVESRALRLAAEAGHLDVACASSQPDLAQLAAAFASYDASVQGLRGRLGLAAAGPELAKAGSGVVAEAVVPAVTAGALADALAAFKSHTLQLVRRLEQLLLGPLQAMQDQARLRGLSASHLPSRRATGAGLGGAQEAGRGRQAAEQLVSQVRALLDSLLQHSCTLHDGLAWDKEHLAQCVAAVVVERGSGLHSTSQAAGAAAARPTASGLLPASSAADLAGQGSQGVGREPSALTHVHPPHQQQGGTSTELGAGRHFEDPGLDPDMPAFNTREDALPSGTGLARASQPSSSAGSQGLHPGQGSRAAREPEGRRAVEQAVGAGSGWRQWASELPLHPAAAGCSSHLDTRSCLPYPPPASQPAAALQGHWGAEGGSGAAGGGGRGGMVADWLAQAAGLELGTESCCSEPRQHDTSPRVHASSTRNTQGSCGESSDDECSNNSSSDGRSSTASHRSDGVSVRDMAGSACEVDSLRKQEHERGDQQGVEPRTSHHTHLLAPPDSSTRAWHTSATSPTFHPYHPAPATTPPSLHSSAGTEREAGRSWLELHPLAPGLASSEQPLTQPAQAACSAGRAGGGLVRSAPGELAAPAWPPAPAPPAGPDDGQLLASASAAVYDSQHSVAVAHPHRGSSNVRDGAADCTARPLLPRAWSHFRRSSDHPLLSPNARAMVAAAAAGAALNSCPLSPCTDSTSRASNPAMPARRLHDADDKPQAAADLEAAEAPDQQQQPAAAATLMSGPSASRAPASVWATGRGARAREVLPASLIASTGAGTTSYLHTPLLPPGLALSLASPGPSPEPAAPIAFLSPEGQAGPACPTAPAPDHTPPTAHPAGATCPASPAQLVLPQGVEQTACTTGSQASASMATGTSLLPSALRVSLAYHSPSPPVAQPSQLQTGEEGEGGAEGLYLVGWMMASRTPPPAMSKHGMPALPGTHSLTRQAWLGPHTEQQLPSSFLPPPAVVEALQPRPFLPEGQQSQPEADQAGRSSQACSGGAGRLGGLIGQAAKHTGPSQIQSQGQGQGQGQEHDRALQELQRAKHALTEGL